LLTLLIVENMLDRMDILNTSLVFMAWGKCFLRNDELLDKAANHILNLHKQKLFYEEEATSEITNIV
jgi:hypothetical protein